MITSQSRTQRLTARSIIAAFVVLGLVILFVPNGALGSIFQLQQTGSPTGSPTETGSPTGSPTGGSPSPAPTGIQEIQFINPSAGNSTVVSTKNDGTDTTYHLVAVARQVPANPLVEFKYQVGTGNEVSIGIASRVGTSDAFELSWAVPSNLEGSVVLKAILYNGAIELGRDEITATVNNADTLENPQAETVEMTYPRNGANAGFFQPQGAAAAFTVVNTTSSVAIGPPSTSRGTATVTVRYTKTPTGQNPAWVSCGSGTPSSTGTTSVRCTLAEGDTPAMVTAIAAQASPPVAPLAPGSGDAHRVFPYDQVPTSVGLDPGNQSGKPAGACADVVTATIRDQEERPIAGANTDVHAKGPGDNLRFDDSGDNSSAHQAPDKAHPAPEQAWNCEGTGGNGNQGDHELTPGNPDIKHIETAGTGTQATTGTDNAGQFKFQLYSPEGPGRTAIAVFVDTDGDDEWCADEASGEGSIEWSPSASPSPTASPTGSPSGSPTGSPTGSPGSTSEPSPEPTDLRPERADCPAGPTGSASPTDGPTANRTISLESNKAKVVQRRPITLSGRIEGDSPECEDNELIEIERRIHGTNNFRSFKTTASDDDGTFEVRTKPARGADYRAVAPADGACDEAGSTVESVRVRPRVRIAAENYKGVPRGSRISIIGDVTPGHTNDRVVLQRRKGGKWVKVEAQKLNRNSRYRFVVRSNWNKRNFRVIWPKQDQDHVKGKSRTITIRTA
ncbi:MAG: hypothetical protein M3277_08380 [Actinomycetota bacterium]|nr:hypothetical protein [Actinomycetota bacterium]